MAEVSCIEYVLIVDVMYRVCYVKRNSQYQYVVVT